MKSEFTDVKLCGKRMRVVLISMALMFTIFSTLASTAVLAGENSHYTITADKAKYAFGEDVTLWYSGFQYPYELIGTRGPYIYIRNVNNEIDDFDATKTIPDYRSPFTWVWDQIKNDGTYAGNGYYDAGIYTILETPGPGGIMERIPIIREPEVRFSINEGSPPVAVAGLDQSVYESEEIFFDGSNSDDLDGYIKSCRWDFDASVDSNNDGDSTNDADATDETPTTVYYDNDVYIVTLWVFDDDGLWGKDSITITVINQIPIVEIGRRYEFDTPEIIEDEWGLDNDYPGEWFYAVPNVGNPTGCWHSNIGSEGEGIFKSLHGFKYTHGQTQIFKINIRHRLEISDNQYAKILIYNGGEIIVTDILFPIDNTYTDWAIREYDISDKLTSSNGPINIEFRFGTYENTGERGWSIDYIDIIGLDEFSTADREKIHFRSELEDSGDPNPGSIISHIYLWEFFGTGNPPTLESTAEEENPTYTFTSGPPVSAELTVTDDDGASGSDQGVGSVNIVRVYPDGQTKAIQSEIASIPDAYFDKNPDHRRNALQNKLDSVLNKIENGNYQGAINKLQNDVRKKMDGSVGGNPKNDWIIEPTEQLILTGAIDDLIYSLSLQT